MVKLLRPIRILEKPHSLKCQIQHAAIAAPAIEPINVCEELDGIPKYHVSKFQVIADNNAAKITMEPINGASGCM